MPPPIVSTRPSRVVWVGNAPSASLTEPCLTAAFGAFGTIESTRIHRDLMDSSAMGFCYIKYATIEEAQAAIDAVNEQKVTLPESLSGFSFEFSPSTQRLQARFGFDRGDVVLENEPDQDTIDLLNGVRLAVDAERRQWLSQQSVQEDEDEILLQNFSQNLSQQTPSTAVSSTTKKRKKKHKKRKLSIPEE